MCVCCGGGSGGGGGSGTNCIIFHGRDIKTTWISVSVLMDTIMLIVILQNVLMQLCSVKI